MFNSIKTNLFIIIKTSFIITSLQLNKLVNGNNLNHFFVLDYKFSLIEELIKRSVFEKG